MTIRNAPSSDRPVAFLRERAKAMRRHMLRMSRAVGQGYLAQGLGIADALAAIYFHELRYDPANGYLKSVLDALGIQTDSQVLVFSKTSFQAAKIGPKNPRALFFNDSVVVGWVRTGDVLEFLSTSGRPSRYPRSQGFVSSRVQSWLTVV